MVNDNRRTTTIDTIYEKIKKKIVELVYEPDQHLVEESLSSEFGVSRTPLRHALYRLELEGFVVKKTTGRIHVSSMSIKEAEEIFLVRELLEGLVAKQATLNISNNLSRESILSRLEDVTFLMRKSAETNRQVDVVRYGNEFHNLLQHYSDNETAVNMLEQINIRISRYRRIGAYKDPRISFNLPS